MSIIDFLIQLRRSISEFTENISEEENNTLSNRRNSLLKFQLSISYYKAIEFYFRDTGISADLNMMTEEEIQVIIDKLNNIMDTYLYTDFT